MTNRHSPEPDSIYSELLSTLHVYLDMRYEIGTLLRSIHNGLIVRLMNYEQDGKLRVIEVTPQDFRVGQPWVTEAADWTFHKAPRY